MNGPCDCGAEDCPKCFPGCNEPKGDDGPEPDVPKTYRGSDKDNEWMDYICEGYRDAPY